MVHVSNMGNYDKSQEVAVKISSLFRILFGNVKGLIWIPSYLEGMLSLIFFFSVHFWNVLPPRPRTDRDIQIFQTHAVVLDHDWPDKKIVELSANKNVL